MDKPGQNVVTLRAVEVGQASVGRTQMMLATGGNAENFACRPSLRATKGGKRGRSSWEIAVRGFPVGEPNNLHLDATAAEGDDEPATTERFVVRVRCDDEDGPRGKRVEERPCSQPQDRLEAVGREETCPVAK